VTDRETKLIVVGGPSIRTAIAQSVVSRRAMAFHSIAAMPFWLLVRLNALGTRATRRTLSPVPLRNAASKGRTSTSVSRQAEGYGKVGQSREWTARRRRIRTPARPSLVQAVMTLPCSTRWQR
jgi:hypothetical protein